MTGGRRDGLFFALCVLDGLPWYAHEARYPPAGRALLADTKGSEDAPDDRAHDESVPAVVRPDGGRQALPVFGFREEAEMFLKLGGLESSWRAKENRGGELVSVLAGPCRGVGSVAIDPVPGMLRYGTMPLVGVDRGRFLERLVGFSPARFPGNGRGPEPEGRGIRPDGHSGLPRFA